MEPGDLVVKINNYKESDAEKWDQLLMHDNQQQSYEYFRILGNHTLNNFINYYVFVYHDRQLIATTHCFVDGKFKFHGILSGMCDNLYRLFPIGFKTLFLSSPISEHNTINIAPHFTDHQAAIIDAIILKVHDFAKKSKIDMIVLKDHLHEYPSSNI